MTPAVMLRPAFREIAPPSPCAEEEFRVPALVSMVSGVVRLILPPALMMFAAVMPSPA